MIYLKNGSLYGFIRYKYVYVVVQFFRWFKNFQTSFPLSQIHYHNCYRQWKTKIKPKQNLNNNMYTDNNISMYKLLYFKMKAFTVYNM